MLDLAYLSQQAATGTLLLTPNLRNVRQLRSQLAAFLRGSAQTGEHTFQNLSPDSVLHWRGWVNTLWQLLLLEGREDRVLLQSLQERLLWEAVLQADSQPVTNALVNLCLRASNLVFQYEAQSSLLAHAGTSGSDDTVRFARWFRQVQHRCDVERMLPAAALEGALVHHVQAGLLPECSGILTCSLDILLPSEAALLRAVEEAGVPVKVAPRVESASTPPVLMRCADATDEWRTLASHLHRVLEGETRPDIAVIVPDLSESRDRIDRTMRDYLPPAASDPFHEDRHPLWEFSTGRPLAATSIVAEALRLLEWPVRELDAGEVSSLLRSPYLLWPVGSERVAELESTLLRRGNRMRATWTPRAAAQQLAKASEPLAQALHQRTAGWRRGQAFATYAAHAERCRQVLHDFGWPGERTCSSEEFQAVQRWEAVLDAMAALDLVAPPISVAGFTRRLLETAQATPFARENTGAPIQFLTPEESAGITAEHIWFAHADESRWNSSASVNPLLPWRLQQQSGMPGIDPARDEAAFCDSLQRILNAAPAVTFSYAHTDASGELRPCLQVEQLPGLRQEEATISGALPAVDAAGGLERFTDTIRIPLAITGEPVAGGVSILKSQAACAFRAFAETRLGASTLDSHDLGLDARDRGNVLHRALHLFWQGTQTRDALRELIRSDRLDAAIHHAVAHALQPEREAQDRWAEHYHAIEQERLEKLLRYWLQFEAERPSFEVECMEQEVDVTVGDLPLKVRVDRVDLVEAGDGSVYRVIVDYKTGDLNQKRWEGNRPEEPQLPLYAAIANATGESDSNVPVGAIAFGIIRAGDTLGFQSLPRKSALLHSGDKANATPLGAEIEDWRETLTNLAADFVAGKATVGPKQYPATCTFCDQRLLCRLNPELLNLEDEDAEVAP